MHEASQLSEGAGLLLALLLTAALAGLHVAAPRIRALLADRERQAGSFAGGLAVSYVFLHLLPEIAAGNQGVAEALEERVEITPLVDLGIFLVALVGFLAFYGLERLAERRAPQGRDQAAGGTYALHLGSFMVYNALITYTMPLRVRTGVLFAVLFTVAMGLHFVLTDRGLGEHYPRRFRRAGRFWLAGALLAGWAAATAAAPTRTLLVSLLTALLGGSVLLNVFKEELPSGRRSSFAWFLIGAALYAALLGAVTAVEE